ncbi:RluA family pseudouridine synthase [Faecalimonas sp.]
MKRIFTYKIPAEFEHNTLLSFLKAEYYSSPIIRHLKQTENGILLNGNWARVGDILHEDDLLTITLLETCSSQHIVPVPLPLNIVYEDDDLMVINKPANMPIHPSQNNYENTLANAVAHYFNQKGVPFVYRCINRLDRDTTGLLIIAKHMYSASLLSNMVKNRSIHREYLAIADGNVNDEGIIEAPIARVQSSTIEREVNFVDGDFARTCYKCLKKENGYSLVSLKLETGRTHQIRVHMKYIGHALLGDFLYNPDYTFINRQALHSYRLTFMHPLTKESLTFTAPLPPDMSRLFT